MKYYQKTMTIYGTPTDVRVYVDAGGTEWLRFHVEGTWGAQTVTHDVANAHICINNDASLSISTQKLILAENASNDRWLEAQMDKMLNSLETALGLSPDTLSSSSNWVGSDSDEWDYLMTSFEKAIIDGNTVQAIMPLNTFANICGFFYNHCIDPALCEHETVNGGYNCSHPEQEEGEDGIGSCYAWSCPLCYLSDGETCAKSGMTCSECEDCGDEHCECEDDYVVATIPRHLFNKVKMYLLSQ